MRELNRTIIMIVVFSLAAAIPAPAQTSTQSQKRTFTISGRTGVGGLRMMGLPGNPVTNEKGYYSVTVDYGWSGTVTPTREGFTSVPHSKVYHNVVSDRTNENYVPQKITYTISGTVGIPGVEMKGLPGNTVSDETGSYSSTVMYGWTGMVMPAKEGYTFNPPRLNYTKVMRDLQNQNYTAEQQRQVVWRFERGRWVPMQTGRSAGYGMAIASTADRKVLVVPAAEVKAQDLAEIIEDMQVMSHILDERFKETRRVQGAFTDFGDFFGRDNRQTEATYLQGYGVLFSMEVNFAFSPPPEPQGQEAEQNAENVDSTWQRARQQVFSPGDPRRSRRYGSAEEYNSQMVEELKRDLITTLKHAANIRGVLSDELVILTVIGGGRQSGGGGFMMGGMGGMMGGGYGVSGGSSGSSSRGMMGGMSSGGMGGGMMGGGMGGMAGSSMGGQAFGGGVMMGGGMGGSSATVLTIRAKKSDIDDFAEGQQDFEQFRQKVQTFTY